MKSSRRARRMERHHSRLNSRFALNLVSLMDIFTILVFFLLVNTAQVQNLPDPEDLALPESTARQTGDDSVVVMLTRERILVDGEPLMSHAEAMAGDEATIPQLAAALQRATPDRIGEPTKEQAELGRGTVTIMADKGLPYKLLRKVMLTSTAAQFGRISLAVLQQEQQG